MSEPKAPGPGTGPGKLPGVLGDLVAETRAAAERVQQARHGLDRGRRRNEWQRRQGRDHLAQLGGRHGTYSKLEVRT